MWYANHLQVSSRVIPIVLVTPQPQVVTIESCSLPFRTNQLFSSLSLLASPSSPSSPFLHLSFPPLKWYDGFDAGTTEGLLVVGVGDYLTCFWPDLAELHSLYESLEASVRATRKEGEWEGGREVRGGELSCLVLPPQERNRSTQTTYLTTWFKKE